MPVVLTLAGPGCSSQSTGDVSKELADSLTDSMEFKNGTKVEGSPPPANAGSADHPQITLENSPDRLAAGEGFNVKIKTDYRPLSAALILAPAKTIKAEAGSAAFKAVVYVWNSQKNFSNYILVDAVLNPDGTVDLPGKMKDDITWLKKNDTTFRVFVALGIVDGDTISVGNYVEWAPTIYYAYCVIALEGSACPGAYGCQMLDNSYCWLGYFDLVFMCDYCPATEADFKAACLDAISKLTEICSSSQVNCEYYAQTGYCMQPKGCCDMRGGGCWYEADDGTRFYCDSSGCGTAGQQIYNYCMGG
jgi:hypothetical protein